MLQFLFRLINRFTLNICCSKEHFDNDLHCLLFASQTVVFTHYGIVRSAFYTFPHGGGICFHAGHPYVYSFCISVPLSYMNTSVLFCFYVMTSIVHSSELI